MSIIHSYLDSSLLRMPTAEVPEPGSGGQGMHVKQGEKGKTVALPFPRWKYRMGTSSWVS